MTPPALSGLYPIADLDALESRDIDVGEFCRRVLAARPPLLQLRAKHAPARRTLAVLRGLKDACASVGTRLVANDRPDLALLGGADVVHVGQDDLGIEQVRSIAPALSVGISTHTIAELGVALASRPLYVAFGPVYATGSKERPDPVVGVEGLTRASLLARAAGVPLVAIGGIDLDRLAEVAPLADAVAVIGALLPTSSDLAEVTERALALSRALGARP